MDKFTEESADTGGDGITALVLVVMSVVWLAIGAAFGVWLS